METIIDLFERSCAKFPDNPYLWEKRGGQYEAMSYSRTHGRVIQIAGGLLAMGLKKGQRVALLSEGCSDWVCSELGILYAGGISVPLSVRLTEEELVFRICHSGARFLFVSSYYLQSVRSIAGRLEGVEKIIVFRPTAESIERCISFSRLLKEGKRFLGLHSGRVEAMARSLKSSDTANISYTSGTMAEPKGILLTHGNYVCNVLQADSLIRIPQHYRVLLFLPWDHSFAHTVGIYSFMYNGASLAAVDFGASPVEFLRNIPRNMQEIKPHVLLSVPAMARNFRKNIEAGVKQKGRLAACLYKTGLRLAYWYYGEGNFKKKGMKIMARPLLCLFDKSVFSGIRSFFGGKLRFFVGGGALLDTELQKYFRALGIPMYQGYGLSEASPVISTNTPGRYKFGSSGLPVTPLELSIRDEQDRPLPVGETGEIVIRGGNVMRGYWRNEAASVQALRDGYLHTGDLGFLDAEGFLTVLGRFKCLLIANDGEKYSPEGIEEAIVEKSPYIDYCMLYNNQSPYTVGLLVPNKTALKEYVLRKQIVPGSVEAYKVMLEKLRNELMEYRHGGRFAGMFPERWLPAVTVVLPASLTEKDGTLNSTSKMVRRRIAEVYGTEIEYAYTPEGKDITNSRNTRNMKLYFQQNDR